MKNTLVAAILVSASLLLSACVMTMQARLYNTDTGEVLQAAYLYDGSGHGLITLTTKDGIVLKGEYTTLDNSTMRTSSAKVFGWAVAQGFSFESTSMQYGSAVVTGGGLVIEIVYQTSALTGHGYGVGKDNKGNKYRLQF